MSRVSGRGQLWLRFAEGQPALWLPLSRARWLPGRAQKPCSSGEAPHKVESGQGDLSVCGAGLGEEAPWDAGPSPAFRNVLWPSRRTCASGEAPLCSCHCSWNAFSVLCVTEMRQAKLCSPPPRPLCPLRGAPPSLGLGALPSTSQRWVWTDFLPSHWAAFLRGEDVGPVDPQTQHRAGRQELLDP